MAAKTITIDLEAYRRLKQAQMENESFSQTIKRVVQPRAMLESWFKRVGRIKFSDDFTDAVERQIRSRSRRSRRASGTS